MALVNCELVRKTAEYYDAKDYGANPCSCDFKELLWQHMRYNLCGPDYPVPCDSDECNDAQVVSCGVTITETFPAACTGPIITEIS